ncbi:unnamed protein product [Effrenium voratum]|uniref:Uncharacterized protein n=1 Tax=Effrenium voratum TaxID=2562239 RepID=A0AA36JPJ2_9DINO|nr:unnamed protein product [Effrenium voratum]
MEAEAAGREGESAVHLASLLGHEEVVKALLQAGASANLAALDGKTALSHACYRGHLQVARSLLQHRARCDVVDRGQRSPLHWAAETGQEALLDILLPCSLDAQDLQGWTPLMATAQQGHVATARRLLEGKASLEPQGLDGETAVMLAALNGHIEMLRLLVIHRADLNQPAGDGMTPLKLAGEAGHAEAVQRLLAMGAEVPPEGLALKGQADSSDELALTASLARQLSAELKSAATLEAADALARRWGFDDAQRLLGAVSAAEAHELEAHLSLLKEWVGHRACVKQGL